MPDTQTMLIVLVMLMLTVVAVCVTLLGFRFLDLANDHIGRIFPSRTDHRFEQRLRAIEAEAKADIRRVEERVAKVQANLSKVAADQAFSNADQDD